MQKRQYIFIWLMIVLFYLSFKIIQFEYKKYIISGYIKEQKKIINEISNYLVKSDETLKFINTKWFKNSILKSENWMKMKWEDVIVLTSEKIYNKFSWKKIIEIPKFNENKKENDLTFWMTNFQKWIYFFLKKDIR